MLDPEGRDQNREVEHLARHLQSESLDKVSIVVFIQNDAQRAKAVAQSLHKAIAGKAQGMDNKSVGLSWFDKAEPVGITDKSTISLSEGVLIFSAPQDNRNKEKTI